MRVYRFPPSDLAVVAPGLSLPDKPSIAVLPFQNLSGDPEQEYFADGMVEDIITGLSRIKWLFVIARNSTFIYKGRAVDVKQVGRELGVRYVLEGSVRKAGDRVRITGQLIDASTGTHAGRRRGRKGERSAREEPMQRPIGAVALISWLVLGAAAWSQSQSYPSHPVKILIGPSPDIFARIVGEHLQQAWGQPIVVEPRPGAGGKLAVQAVSTAAPDGYTMLFATPTYTLNTAMKAASYDLLKEFEPVAIIGLISYALVIHPSIPAKSVAELVAYAKQNPGKLNCASAGIGTVPHLACEFLNKVAGINIVHGAAVERPMEGRFPERQGAGGAAQDGRCVAHFVGWGRWLRFGV